MCDVISKHWHRDGIGSLPDYFFVVGEKYPGHETTLKLPSAHMWFPQENEKLHFSMCRTSGCRFGDQGTFV